MVAATGAIHAAYLHCIFLLPLMLPWGANMCKAGGLALALASDLERPTLHPQPQLHQHDFNLDSSTILPHETPIEQRMASDGTDSHGAAWEALPLPARRMTSDAPHGESASAGTRQGQRLLEERLVLDGPGSKNSLHDPRKRWEAVARAKKREIEARRGEAAGRPRENRTGYLKRIAIVGERHSGTTYMMRLLRINIDPGVVVQEHLCGVFKHRYMYPNLRSCGNLNRTLIIIMLRNPYDWAAAMHRRCYCSTNDEVEHQLAKLDFKAFLERPWVNDSYYNATIRTPDKRSEADGTGTNPHCSRLMECRALKYRNFLNISAWAPHVEFVRHEDVLSPDQSTTWLAKLIPRYHLESTAVDDKLDPVVAYKDSGQEFNLDEIRSRSVWLSQDVLFKTTAGRGAAEESSAGVDAAAKEAAAGAAAAAAGAGAGAGAGAAAARGGVTSQQMYTLHPEVLRQRARLVNLLMDHELERMVGYPAIGLGADLQARG